MPEYCVALCKTFSVAQALCRMFFYVEILSDTAFGPSSHKKCVAGLDKEFRHLEDEFSNADSDAENLSRDTTLAASIGKKLVTQAIWSGATAA